MAIQSDITVLQLFNEKADKLESLSFTKSIQSGGFGLTFRATNEGAEISPHGPDSEAVEAFVLTLRFFVQDNERASIRNIAQKYEVLPVSQQLKDRITAVRKGINGYLDQLSPFIVFEEALTRRDIFDIFLYGGLAHAAPAKYDKYRQWQAMPLVFPFLEVEFAMVLTNLLQGIFRIREINKDALNELRPQKT